MTNTQHNLDKQAQALAPLHRDIKGVCERIGIDVQGAETFAEAAGYPLPWHGSVTPQRCLNQAASILRETPEPGGSAWESLEHFATAYLDSTLGLIGALAVVDNKFLDSATKAAFLAYFPFKSYENFAQPVPQEVGDPATEPNGLQGLLCWLVHDVLAMQVFDQSGLSTECAKALNILSNNLGVELAEHAFYVAQNASAGDVNLKNQVEGVLLSLARTNPAAGSRVKEILGVFTSDCKSSEAPIAIIRRLDELQRLYPCSLKAQDLSGERIHKEASGFRETARAALTLTNMLEAHLTSKPEWALPLLSVAQDIRDKGTVQLKFNDCRIVASQKARDILVEIIKETPRVQVIFSVDQFLSRGPNDEAMYTELADELNNFIETDLPSALITKLNIPDFAAQKDQTVDFLRAICDAAGRKNVTVLAPEQVATFTPAMGVLTCLITSARADMANVGETVDISLKGREQNDSAITSLSHGVKLGLPRVWVANGIDLAIFNCVIPLLGKKDLPKDQYGLNGYRSQKVALSLSGKNIDGIGQLPILTPDDTCKMNREFVLVYTGNDEQPEDAQPIDSEDTGLDEDPAETEDLVHKV